jgi:hypothetical protein
MPICIVFSEVTSTAPPYLPPSGHGCRWKPTDVSGSLAAPIWRRLSDWREDTEYRSVCRRESAADQLQRRGAVHAEPLLMTGRHPVRTGCMTALPGSGLVAWEVTIADKLKALGYSNAIYEKWHCGENVGRLPTDKGFDMVTVRLAPGTLRFGPRTNGSKRRTSSPNTSLNPKARGICERLKSSTQS